MSNGRNTSSRGEKKGSKTIKMIYDMIDEMAGEGSESGTSDQTTTPADCFKKIDKAVEKLNRGAGGLKKLTNEANETIDGKSRDGETVLHRAIARLTFKSDDAYEMKVIRLLVDRFPELAAERRPNSDKFRGQTPVHMAVTKGVHKVVDILLTKLSPDTQVLKELETERSVGSVFRNTVMMAELPLSVAALKNDRKMFQQLLQYGEHGAALDARNSKGDNVCHSLIKYAYLYPEKLEDVRSMLQYINDDDALDCVAVGKMDMAKKLRKKIWFMKNDEGLNPLQLAAKFGQYEIFKDIMELPGFCSRNDTDGLFDIKVYDVTEIDAIAFGEPYRNKEKSENLSKLNVDSKTNPECRVSVLRRLLELDPKCAFQFVSLAPVRQIIDEKWNAYRLYFYPWFLLHVLYVSFLTWYATHRSLQNVTIAGDLQEPDFTNPLLGQSFSLAFGIINILVGITLLTEAGVRVFNKRMRQRLSSVMNPYSNMTFRLLFVVFGLSLIIDFVCAASFPCYENYMLMLAVFIGWFLMLFFLRAFRPFSFFTVMIQNVLVGDLLRFSVIIFCELIAFTTVMFMAIQGASEVDSEYSHYGRVLLSMFKLMVGLGDVGLVYQTRHPGLTIFISVGFIILTTLLMINSLIAMISRTSTELVEERGMASARDIHWKLQRLSLVLYIESILPRRFVRLGGKVASKWYSNLSEHNGNRYCLEIRSLLDADNAFGYDDAQQPAGKRDLDQNFLDTLVKSVRDRVGHQDEVPEQTNKVLENEKDHVYDEKLATNVELMQSFSTIRSVKSSVDIYNHINLCDNCSTMTKLDNDKN